MNLPGLIDLCLLLILASHSKGQKWKIYVDRNINATVGSDVTIKCHYSIPAKYNTTNPKVYWKKIGSNTFDTGDNDKNPFVYHTNSTFVLEKYRGKTDLIGDIKNGDCTLRINKIMDSDQHIYVRVIAGDRYSFFKYTITIRVKGRELISPIPDNANSASPTFESSTMKMPKVPQTTPKTTIYIAIFVPVAALLLIIFITGIVFWTRRRSKSITREDSGYYANFRRTSSNQAKRDASCKKQDTKKLPESKVIDEPVYINFEVPLGQMHQSNDHTDSVYANVDYSKQ